ncbi:hypothetical protein GCM10009715_30480 [Paeniglutamicibacter psychrophenolicus]
MARDPGEGLFPASLLSRWPASALAEGVRQAGRITIHECAGIHLMEDLDTNDLPDIGEVHGGMLEIWGAETSLLPVGLTASARKPKPSCRACSHSSSTSCPGFSDANPGVSTAL